MYRYRFDRRIPIAPDTKVNGVAATAHDIGARHAGEIEYVFGTLDSVPHVTWEEADRRLSDLMMSYWSNFARSAQNLSADQIWENELKGVRLTKAVLDRVVLKKG